MKSHRITAIREALDEIGKQTGLGYDMPSEEHFWHNENMTLIENVELRTPDHFTVAMISVTANSRTRSVKVGEVKQNLLQQLNGLLDEVVNT